MRSTILLTITAFVLTSASCSSGVRVRTTVAPDANLSGLHTFRVLGPPQRRTSAPPLSENDPMLDNSITNRELRDDLVKAFEARGYALDGNNPDFVVAYYAGTKEKMDTTYWNPDPWYRYGYRYGVRAGRSFSWAWPWYSYATPPMQVTEYTEGSVIVDVVDPRSKELLWRGQGVAAVSDQPEAYRKDLAETVGAILKKFPRSPGQ